MSEICSKCKRPILNNFIGRPKTYNHAKILKLRSEGKTFKEIAKELGCSISLAHKVCSQRSIYE